MVLAEKIDDLGSIIDDAVTVAVEFAESEADAATGLEGPKENIPLPTTLGLLSALLGDSKPNEELAGVVSVELGFIASAANVPKVTADLVWSVAEVVLLVVGVVFGVTTAAGCTNEKPVLLAVSAGLLAGEPKLNPLVFVVEVTVSELFAGSFVTDLVPKLNPPEPRVVTGAVGSFSLFLELSVVSEGAAGLLPKLKPVAGAAVVAAEAVLPLPKLNLGLSSELVVLVVDVTDPKLKPLLVDDVEPVDVLEGTPKENPDALGASFPSEP